MADQSCEINDPNGPFFDPTHGVYHNFYQRHLALDMNGAGNGPIWGHWVSRDFVHWAQLPVAIWNDQYYDNSAIYTGSTTLVDGKPVIMYPGMCRGDLGCNSGKGGFTYALAVPKNASDPLYTEWAKAGEVGGRPFGNPLLSDTGDDPSSAWRTELGEWRFIGNQRCTPAGGAPGSGSPMYGSFDFVVWYKIGCSSLAGGDCPSLFELPGLTPGSEHYVPAHGPLPTHVHKAGGEGGDQMQVGRWTSGLPGPEGIGSVGMWEQTPQSTSAFCDRGSTHASKDFFDPTTKRRILWMWATVPGGAQTVPRHLTYHPGLRQIVHAPVEEMLKLRLARTGTLRNESLLPGTEMGIPIGATGASDVEVFFSLPAQPTQLSVGLTGGNLYIDFVPNANGSAGSYAVQVGINGVQDSLRLLPDDTEIGVRVFLDGTLGEAYFMGGRVAMTFPIQPATSIGFATTAAPVGVLRAEAYIMGPINTTAEAVLRTPARMPLAV